MKARIHYALAILLFIGIFLYTRNFQICQRLSCISMDDLINFKIKDIYAENKSSFRSLYAYGNILLRVEVLSQPDQYSASQYIAANISQVKGLFADSLAPYPGTVSKTITCEEKYQPNFKTLITPEKLEISYFTAFLNNSLTYGSCDENQLIYKGISTYFHCPKNELVYHLELISPIIEYESSATTIQRMIESIKCK